MKRPLLMSLYSGAGGLDYGFEAAGFETGVCVEFDAHCCETLRVSRPGWSVIERSIFDVPTSEMLACCDRSPGEVDLLIGGPPCQPFSKAGYWARGDSMRLNDPRASTLDACDGKEFRFPAATHRSATDKAPTLLDELCAVAVGRFSAGVGAIGRSS